MASQGSPNAGVPYARVKTEAKSAARSGPTRSTRSAVVAGGGAETGRENLAHGYPDRRPRASSHIGSSTGWAAGWSATP